MEIYELYSDRKKKESGESPDVYCYDTLPEKLKNQIVHICDEALFKKMYEKHMGTCSSKDLSNFYYGKVRDILLKELGRLTLVKDNDLKTKFEGCPRLEVLYYFINLLSISSYLDVIEVCFRVIDIQIRKQSQEIADDAIAELNERFKRAGVGYQYEEGKIIRIDSQLIHSEAVKPVLNLLKGEGYEGVNQEFLSAHEHYRHGRHKECLNDCYKAFESTMKVICKEHGWRHSEGAAAKDLMNVCKSNDLFPSYLESKVLGFQNLLASGITTIRNKNSGHGQGAEVQDVPENLAQYALNLTATTLLFLIKCSQNKRKLTLLE